MTFVYVPPPPSERARRLGRELLQTIEQFRRSNPGTTSLEIRQAARIAQREAGAGRRPLLVMLALGVALLLGLLVAVLARSR
jgi:hypothetical protein